MNKIGNGILRVALFIGALTWDGFTILKLWGWFVAPLFGLPVLALLPAIGLNIAVQSFMNASPKPDEEDIDRALWVLFGRPALLLVVGFIVHKLMG